MGRVAWLWLLCVAGALACRDVARGEEPPSPAHAASLPSYEKPAPIGTQAPGVPREAQESVVAPDPPGAPRGSPAHSDPARLQLGFAEPQPQRLACGELGFVRLRNPGFDVFSYFGLSLILRQTEGAFDHVVAQPGHSYVLVGRGSSLVFYHPHPRLLPLAHLPALGPLSVFADPRDRQRVWVHYLRDDAVHHFELQPLPGKAVLLGSVSLPGYSGRHLIRLWGGAWAYYANSEFSAVPHLRRALGERLDWIGAAPRDVGGLVSGWGTDFWTLTATAARRYTIDPLARAVAADVVELPGVAWAAATEGRRLALLLQREAPNERAWWLLIYDSGRRHLLEITDWVTEEEPNALRGMGLCLAPGRPLAVLGGDQGLGVWDYQAERWLLR